MRRQRRYSILDDRLKFGEEERSVTVQKIKGDKELRKARFSLPTS